MTGYKVSDEWLDFSGTVGLEIRSPLFDTASVPGTLSYPNTFADTPRNRRLLRFPATRSRQAGPVPVVEADYYIGGTLWRRGTLRYQEFDSKAREYVYQFEADADALASRLDGATLPDVVSAPEAVATAPETDDYVLAPVRNNTFYGEKNPDWGRVVNYFAPGAPTASVNNAAGPHRYALAPMLKVVPLLRRALGQYGYEVRGSWLDDAEIQQLVLYSTRALDSAAGPEPAVSFTLAEAAPNVRIADLLLALQQLFCLGFVFNPVRRQVSIVALRDVATAPAATRRTAGAYFKDVANATDGFLLAFAPDGNDELLKAAPWPELRIGGAKESIKPEADTLRMVREPDPLSPGRSWLVPAAGQAGQSPRLDFEQVDNRLEHLRFLFYRGLQADSTGALYPLASSGVVDYANLPVGRYALAWDGPAGLYQQWHKPWLDFRAAARIEERDMPLSVADFLSLDPTRKDLVQGLKFLWERISITAGGDGALSAATVTYHQIAS
ncbi:hypothetical protein Q5H92_22950 [Hymenobacter sp. M29]|uniref:Uncharacterized protein n=1 Tax=Hymenobacter mellowenesis TaxID=3063995 RepID=A0ABT9AHB9_9BACT|nr:hypothetical protein [Hymenobacter sp. M29]MDO7849241.1 hypothetical protein [Hymenobacter sp. M29]